VSSVVCVSHPWLQPDHPDPKGTNIRRLVGMLLDYELVARARWGGGSIGVMIDFCSIMQRGKRNEERTPSETAVRAHSSAPWHVDTLARCSANLSSLLCEP
jgi:hypothetical protein